MDTTHTTPAETPRHRLERPNQGRVLGGVAAAIADHTGSSVAWVRLGFLIGALFGGLGIVLYLAAWALIPATGSTSSPAEQWMSNLTTPGKRFGAFLVGIAGLVIIAGAAPLTIAAAAIILAGAALLAGNGSEEEPFPVAANANISTTETE